MRSSDTLWKKMRIAEDAGQLTNLCDALTIIGNVPWWVAVKGHAYSSRTCVHSWVTGLRPRLHQYVQMLRVRSCSCQVSIVWTSQDGLVQPQASPRKFLNEECTMASQVRCSEVCLLCV